MDGGINVLSLFDGMACGRIALERSNIKVNKYYASEIDKYAIKVANANYPDIIQLGDIRQISGFNLPRIDLLLAGSPCQGFSFAGKLLAFNDTRSALFWEFVRILKETRPKYFLLENVRMKQEYQDIISAALEVKPILINSALVSAQSRKRLYWCNFPISQPQDKGIMLKDIIEDHECVFIMQKARGYNKGSIKRLHTKSATMTSNYWQENNKLGCIQAGNANISNRWRDAAVHSINGKSPTLMANSGGQKEPKITINNIHWRKLTPEECEKLQTVPIGYTSSVSNSQRYKMLGNGWTVDIISHILKGKT